MKKDIVHLTTEAVRAIHEEVLAAHGGSTGIRDIRLLESAVAAPQATYGGNPLIDDPIEIAAAYLFYICANHAFVDGNKRTALASCLVFLDENDLLKDPSLPLHHIDEWEAMVLDVAASKLDRLQTTKQLKHLLRGSKKS